MPRRVPRRIPHKKTGHRKTGRKPLSWKTRLAIAGCALIFGVLAWAAIARALAPRSNTSLTRFDAIIVLGTAADDDGNPKPNQLARVTEAVHEYERGMAPRLILTGGAVSNRFVEARVMARTAEAQGIPASAIVLEPEAADTIENACFSVRLMKEHGWRSAEVVGGAYQLPRAGLIFKSMPIEWRMHEAPPLTVASAAYQSGLSAVEVLKTARYLTWARWMEHCEP